jgi:hypothetical protein
MDHFWRKRHYIGKPISGDITEKCAKIGILKGEKKQ